MSRQPGFVPINFRLAGILLLASGALLCLSVVVARVTHWYTLRLDFGYLGLAGIVVGIYIVLVNREPGWRKPAGEHRLAAGHPAKTVGGPHAPPTRGPVRSIDGQPSLSWAACGGCE